MSEMKAVRGVLEIIKRITSNRESGRLDIDASGTRGTLLFNDGKLVHATLGSLNGFQAVNAVASLRDVKFSFDHVTPVEHSSSISPNERLVLKRFFGIEVAVAEEVAEEEVWNATPEPVVPLAEVAEIPQVDPEEMPTVEVRRIAPPTAFMSRPHIALLAALLLVFAAAAAIGLRSRMKAPQQTASVASAVKSVAPVVASESPVVASESPIVASKSPVAASEHRPVVKSAPPVVKSEPATVVAANTKPEVKHAPVAAPTVRDTKVPDLNGEWRLINTVEKTGYRSFDKMKVGFRVTINQKGKQFTAHGEKFLENGETLAATSRTPIHLTGSIDGDQVLATFVEDGKMRRTNGRFVWKLEKGGDGLTGTFVTTAANSSGRSAVTKQ